MDTVAVSYKIKEGNKEFSSFGVSLFKERKWRYRDTVRKMSGNVGVEKFSNQLSIIDSSNEKCVL